MKLIKKGFIFNTDQCYDWNQSHAQVPTPFYIQDKNCLRVYFSTRSIDNVSRISYVDLDPSNPSKIIASPKKIVLDIGSPGTFDDCGVMPSHVIYNGDEVWLYYLGWNVRTTIPYHNAIGLAISKDNGDTFSRYSEGPLFDRNYLDPFYSGMPFVYKSSNSSYMMWYLSNTEWIKTDTSFEPRYHIKYCHSSNGIDWKRDGVVAIDYKSDDEGGIVRPSIVQFDNYWVMFYCYRGCRDFRSNKEASYRIGCATSSDLSTWTRNDELVDLALSNQGWDSQMLAYPFCVHCDDRLYLFYNGNKFGASGFGYALLES